MNKNSSSSKKVKTSSKKAVAPSNKKMSSRSKKNIKIFFVLGLVVAFVILLILIYKNLFANSDSDRFEGIKNYPLTQSEIDAVKDKINTLGENVDSVKVYTKSKIIRIFVKLKDDISFDKVKEVSNQSIELFSEANLEYYDLEIFYDIEKESEVYPKIGYKHKTRKEFSW